MTAFRKLLTGLVLMQSALFAEETIDMNQLSEAFGNFIGKNLNTSGVEFNLDSLIQGIRNGAAGKPSPLTEEEYESMMATVQQEAFEKTSQENLDKADSFLKTNLAQADVKEIEPKLQYITLQSGTGEVVEETFSPLINYSGKLIDGTVFGSSEESGGAITIPLEHTIPGFKKGISGMKEGEKRRLFIHPDLGYGTMSGHLPPNSLLIFDIEVVKANQEEDELEVDDEEFSDEDA